jgi:hypothetical protein
MIDVLGLFTMLIGFSVAMTQQVEGCKRLHPGMGNGAAIEFVFRNHGCVRKSAKGGTIETRTKAARPK